MISWPKEPTMPSALTKAAEGYPRRAFTVAEIIAMQDAGIIWKTKISN
jgi:hypothetical protein